MIFDYIYFKMYQWNIKKGERDIPKIAPAISISFLLFLNLFTVDCLFFLRNGYDLLFTSEVSAILIFLGLVALSYLGLANNKSHDKIVFKYKEETPAQNIRGTIAVILYIIVTIITAYYFAGQVREINMSK